MAPIVNLIVNFGKQPVKKKKSLFTILLKRDFINYDFFDFAGLGSATKFLRISLALLIHTAGPPAR